MNYPKTVGNSVSTSVKDTPRGIDISSVGIRHSPDFHPGCQLDSKQTGSRKLIQIIAAEYLWPFPDILRV
jgi:hypothetical protein